MAVNPGDYLRVVANMQDTNGSTIQNVFYYENVGATGMLNSVFLAAVEVEMSAIYATIQAHIPNTCDPVSIVVDKVLFVSGELTTLGPVGEIAWTTWGGGTAAADELPQACCAVVNFPTEYAGVQGRKYFGPLSESEQSAGILSSTLQTALAALIAEYLNGFTAGSDSIQPRIMSSKWVDAIALLGGIVNAVVGYQRRRKSGVGV